MRVRFITGIRTGEEVVLTESRIGVGRELDNALRISADGVSRYHARFEQDENGRYYVVDLGSTNGVKVNGKPIAERQLLRENDLVGLGDQIMQLAELAAPGEPKTVLTGASGLDSSGGESPVIQFNFGKGTPPVGQEVPEPVMPSSPTVCKIAPPPSASPVLVPPEKTVTPVEELSAALKKSDFKLFGGAKAKDAASGANHGQKKTLDPKARRRNLLFLTAVLGMAAIFLSLFEIFQEAPAGTTGTVQKKVSPPFVLRYEKEEIGEDNVFRFTLKIENGKADFTLDDLKSQRHYAKHLDNIGETHVELLQRELEKGGYFQAEPPTAGNAENNQRKRRTLLIAYNGKLREMTVENNFAPQSFERIERSIEEFADSHGMQTISKTPQELLEQAQASFNKAEDLFANRNARPENLLMAIRRYQLAVEYLDQFSPKPKLWNEAREKFRNAERIRTDRLRELNSESERLRRIKEYDNLVALYKECMALTDEDSKVHTAARKNLIQVENFLRKRERK